MTNLFRHTATLSCLTICLTLSLSSAAFAIADLTNWVGFNNAPPDQDLGDLYGPEENNYTVTSMTSAGGTFKARRARTANLGGTNINLAELSGPLQGSVDPGGNADPNAYGFAENLSASGTLNFSNPNAADPSFFFGFYNNEPGTSAGIQRLGLSVGDVTPGAGNQFRVQGNVNAGVTGSSAAHTLTTTGAAPPTAQDPVGYAPAGTYNFAFSYTAADDVNTVPNEARLFQASITNGTTTWSRSVTLPTSFAISDTLNSFGFLQFGETVDAPPPEPAFSLTYTFNVSNINYTGDTDISLDGDHNGDGKVDAADYVLWRKLNINGAQGYIDFRANFGANGAGTSAGLGGAVPEPASAVLALVCLVMAGQFIPRARLRW